MNMLDLVIPVIIVLIPMFAGALKGYSIHRLIRIVADFVSSTVSAVSMTFFLDSLLVNTEIINQTDANTPDIFYTGSMLAVTALFWCGFFRLVGFGSKIADREHITLQNDFKRGADTANLVIVPTLRTFEKRIHLNLEQTMQKQNNEIQDCLKDVDNTNIDLMVKCNTVLELIKEQNPKIDQVSAGQSKINSTLEQVAQYFKENPNMYEILVSRIEAITEQQQPQSNTSQKDSEDSDGNDVSIQENKKITLTTTDGKANRTFGHQQQDILEDF